MPGKNIFLHVATLSVVVAWCLSHDLSSDCKAEPVRKVFLRKLLNLASLCCDPGNNASLYAQTEAVEQNSTA